VPVWCRPCAFFTMEAALEMLAWKVSSVRDAARHRARQEQYERWFKTFDAQLRILDRERQKFAAVANQSDTYAFVTGASRTVQWLNKAMAALLAKLLAKRPDDRPQSAAEVAAVLQALLPPR